MPGVEQSVLYMKVTDALREPSPAKLAELSKTYNISDFPQLLCLAVELSPLETVQWVIQLYETKNRNFNETDPKTGDTALHKAITNDRASIVRELLLNAHVDDTIRNKEGLTASEVTNSAEMEQTVSYAENKFAEQMAIRLKQAFKNHDVAELERIYENPRVSVTLNINGVDPNTGTTVLHDSAKSNDIKLVQFILAHGGDPLIRDKVNRRLPEELTTNEEIRKSLSQSARSRAILDQTHAKGASGKAQAPPAMDGYLKKWTNITSGYKLRWFVLKKGELSYYKKPEDAKAGDRLIRGSIGLRHAAVKLDSSEKNKFEIRTPSTRFHLKAAHPAETNKWVWALQNAITSVRDDEKRNTTQGRHERNKSQSQSAANEQSPAPSSVAVAGVAAPAAGAAGSTTAANKSTDAATLETPATPVAPATSPSPVARGNESSYSRTSNGERGRASSIGGSSNGDTWFVNDLNAKGDEDDSEDDYTDDAVLRGPHISAESLIARLSAIKDLMTMLVFQVHDETMRDAITTAQGSIDVLSSDIVMFQRQAKAHQHKVQMELERSDKAQRNWAANYRDLEIQCENLEGQLHALKKQLSPNEEDEDEEFFDTLDYVTGDNTRSKQAAPANEDAPSNFVAPSQGQPQEDQSYSPDDRGLAQHGNSSAAAAVGAGVAAGGALGASRSAEDVHPAAAQQPEGDVPSPSSHPSQANAVSEEHGEAHKSEEPSEEATQPEGSDMTQAQVAMARKIDEQKSFAGYEDPPRSKLALDADNRPKLSLWGILKNLIGKDMTKMTLPVSFNECTSLLQRSAEDMEYVDLLDRAAEAVDDEGLRMAYVAAFAGSSYSSTIDRIAKPFNPLLGETYEYARPDLGYRLFAEQVSHHPPIGALIAESKHWDFYGESNVESHFYGRSFDINPLGLWYVNLRPNKGAAVDSELYSFRKLTSSVVGIMLGNPVVDNYGDMKITNHTNGVTATVTYKARGWRGSSAYKLEGKIQDKSGKLLWTIAGQWNDKIFARKADSNQRLLLWQCHPRHKVPFNLTDFAITLNALPKNLEPWLPPTDTRLRPDQRAMEEGRYGDASEDKNRVENKQRQKRKEREQSGVSYEPQWFRLEKHPVTGLDYYRPINDYWQQRAEQNLADKGDIF